MPTDKPILTFAIDKDLFKRFEDYRFENRIKTQSEAIRRLMDVALSQYENEKGKK